MSVGADPPAMPGPARADGGILHQAADQIQEMLGVHRQLDKLLYQSATHIGGVEFESIFNPIPVERLPPSLGPTPSTTTRRSCARRR